jgi:hypothetical protein
VVHVLPFHRFLQQMLLGGRGIFWVFGEPMIGGVEHRKDLDRRQQQCLFQPADLKAENL